MKLGVGLLFRGPLVPCLSHIKLGNRPHCLEKSSEYRRKGLWGDRGEGIVGGRCRTPGDDRRGSPLIRTPIQRIGWVPTMDAMVGWDPGLCPVSPGKRILGELVNLLTDRNSLYPARDCHAS